LTQTGPILLRLADKFGRFQGTTDVERYEILRWLFWDNQKLSGFMAAYRY
jgi:glutathione S-transferase